jgi:EmrB/QacA subfamily drug resistance transporter
MFIMKKWSVVLVLALAQFVMVLDSTVMNVSISTIVNDLNTSVNSLQTAITFYTLTMAALMLIGAKLSARWGLLRAFIIGSIVYGVGSFMTGIAQNVQTLMLGWSVIEGLGAVLVIPSIAALVAINYKGRDRITAYAIIGGISGAAAAAGPLIGGYITTYLSWRYVFIAEAVIMIIVLLLSRSFKSSKKDLSIKVDILSASLSSMGMVLLVYGLLQSKTWGWITPLATPEVAGRGIAPLGISLVAYMIFVGIVLLKVFWDRQIKLENNGGQPLVSVSMFNIEQLRSGMAVLSSQYIITAAIFFIVPIYLQMVLGLDALKTGIKIFPLSMALIIFSMAGTKLISRYSPRQIVKGGQILLVIGSVSLLASIKPDLTGAAFSIAMFAVGAGLGLLASQISNINMSAVKQSKTSEVGGLQGSLQNLGSSLGTALIGSVLIASLTTGFITNINNSNLSQNAKDYISQNSSTGVEIVPISSIEKIAIENGASKEDAVTITDEYLDAQIAGLKKAAFFLVAISAFSLLLSRGIPNKSIISKM